VRGGDIKHVSKCKNSKIKGEEKNPKKINNITLFSEVFVTVL
jgi:hypothetical protein